jgi:hypothetical protein
MFDDQIRLKAHMKSAFPSRACVMAYLDGKDVYSVLTWGSTVYVTTP